MRYTTHRSRTTPVLVAIAAIAALATASAQQPQTDHRSWLVPSLYGVDNFHAYCSPCHGRDGSGNGPVARALKKAPPDLTTIMIRHNGVFPRGEIRAFIANGSPDLPAHGSSEMPVWARHSTRLILRTARRMFASRISSSTSSPSSDPDDELSIET